MKVRTIIELFKTTRAIINFPGRAYKWIFLLHTQREREGWLEIMVGDGITMRTIKHHRHAKQPFRKRARKKAFSFI